MPGPAELTDPNLVMPGGCRSGPRRRWSLTTARILDTRARPTRQGRSTPARREHPAGRADRVGVQRRTGFGSIPTASGPSLFLFSSEAGVISGWNPTPPTPDGRPGSGDGPGRDLRASRSPTPGRAAPVATDFHGNRVDVVGRRRARFRRWKSVTYRRGPPARWRSRAPCRSRPWRSRRCGRRSRSSSRLMTPASEENRNGRGSPCLPVSILKPSRRR